MMPGTAFVSDASSVLLSPLPPGSALLSPPPSLIGLGVCVRSIFRISRLARPSTTDLDTSVAVPPDWLTDRLAVQQFSARLQVFGVS